MIREVLEENADLRELLFIRGFLATNTNNIDFDNFPFYGNWSVEKISGINFCYHKRTGFHFYQTDVGVAFLFGHAYNPFTMETDERVILEKIALHMNEDDFFDCVDELTGVFVLGIVRNGKISYLTDPSGMQSAYYGIDGEDFYLTSHFQLIGDICGYVMTSFVRELVSYKWYPRVMGGYLPGDISAFEKVRRVIPNIFYTYHIATVELEHKRFYPIKEIEECKSENEYNTVIAESAEILKNNMALVLRKWEKPAISLRGE